MITASVVGIRAAQAVAPAKHMCNVEEWTETLTIAPGESVSVVVDAPPSGQQCGSYTQPSRVTDLTNNFNITVPAGGTAWPWNSTSGNSLAAGTYVFAAKANAIEQEYRIVTYNNVVFQTLKIFVQSPVPGPTGKPTAVAGSNQATVSWSLPTVNPSAVAYTEVYTYVDGDYDELVCTATAPATSCVTDWLPGGTPVQFVTYTYNANDDYDVMSAPSDAVTPTGDATPPFTFCAMNDWSDSVEITLEQSLTLIVAPYPAEPAVGYCVNTTYGNVSTAGGWAAIAAYFDITTTPAGLVWPTAENEPVPVGTYVLTPKSGAVPDRFQVSTVNNTGGSSPNQVLGIDIVRAVPGKTGKPTAVAGDGQATVSWAVPAVNPSAVAYTEVYTYVDGSYDQEVCTVNAPQTSCVVTGLTNGTPVQFVTYAYNSNDDYGPLSDPSDPVTPGVPAPNPAPDSGGETAPDSPTPTPTSALPSAAPPVVVDPLDPIGGTRNPNIPASGLPAGGSVFLVNGQPVPVTITPNSANDPTSLLIEAPGITMKLQGRDDLNDPLGLTSQQALILQSGQTLRSRSLGEQRKTKVQPVAVSSGTGFKPNSVVKFYLLPGTYLGELPTDASGTYEGRVPVTVGLPAGVYTLQANGYAPNGSIRSLSLGALVKQSGAVVRTAKAGTTVRFAANSSVLDAPARTALRALVRKTGKSPITVASLGYVQRSDTNANDQALSTARAKAVGAYLRSLGVKGTYTVDGDGVGGPGAADRKVTVSVTYRK